jgi:hypothetical protein
LRKSAPFASLHAIADAEAARDCDLAHCISATLMRTLADREALAREVLAFAARLKVTSRGA